MTALIRPFDAKEKHLLGGLLLVRLTTMTLPKYTDWHPVDEVGARELTTLTNSPGVVYPFGTTALPQSLQRMKDVSSSYISGYISPQVAPGGMTVSGEMLVARSDGFTTKNYNYLVATNSAGSVFFTGPYKGYGHHVTSGQDIQVNSLFGQTPYDTKGGA
jgi:hypothetical protein